MSRLAAQLLTHHRTDTLRPLFESLAAQTHPDWTLYWLDSGSTPEEYATMECLADELLAGVRVLRSRSETNINFAAGHQSLYASQDAPHVALINDDAILDPGYLTALAAALAADATLGSVSGTVLRWDYAPDGRTVVKSGLADTLGLALTAWQAVSDVGAGAPFDAARYPAGSITSVFGVSGCLPLYRRASVGPMLFEPSYVYYKEDVDAAYRLRRAGFKAGTVGGALAWHKRTLRPGMPRAAVSPRARFYSYRNHLWNLRRNLSVRDWLMYGWAVIPYEAVKAAYLLITSPGTLWRAITGRGEQP